MALAARTGWAQASVATDLWRVAQGTLTRPLALSEGAGAVLWTPAVALDTATRVRIGVEAVHAPSETGVQSGFAGLSVRTGPVTLNAGYGRIGISDVAFTETSPEEVGGAIPIWSQSMSLGAAIHPLPGLTTGAALRALSGRLGPSARSHAGLDLGLRYDLSRAALAVATQFLGAGSAEQGAVYSVGGEVRSAPLRQLSQARVAARYGATLQHGEGAQHLLTASVLYGRLGVDWGAARENAFGDVLWRSRFAVTIGAGGYRVDIARDGGAHGFGATWRFALTGDFR